MNKKKSGSNPPSRKGVFPKRDSSVEKAELELLREKLRELTEQTPEKSATILTDWLREKNKKAA